jgi:hypothetical protein
MPEPEEVRGAVLRLVYIQQRRYQLWELLEEVKGKRGARLVRQSVTDEWDQLTQEQVQATHVLAVWYGVDFDGQTAWWTRDVWVQPTAPEGLFKL